MKMDKSKVPSKGQAFVRFEILHQQLSSRFYEQLPSGQAQTMGTKDWHAICSKHNSDTK